MVIDCLVIPREMDSHLPKRCNKMLTNKLSFVGMQLPGKYKENFDVSSEGPSFGVSIVL